MDTYYVSAVSKNSHGVITHLYIHEEIDKHTITLGIKRTEAYVISLLQKGNILFTIRWNYGDPGWRSTDAQVKIFMRGGSLFLRTVKDAQETDNLDNMIDLDMFIH